MNSKVSTARLIDKSGVQCIHIATRTMKSYFHTHVICNCVITTISIIIDKSRDKHTIKTFQRKTISHVYRVLLAHIGFYLFIGIHGWASSRPN